MGERHWVGRGAGRITFDAFASHKRAFRAVADPGVSDADNDVFRPWFRNGDGLILNAPGSDGDYGMCLHIFPFPT